MNKLEKALEGIKEEKLESYSSVDEMFAKWEKEEREEKKAHPIMFRVKRVCRRCGWIAKDIWNHIWWLVHRDIPCRWKYGCSEKDVWSLDYSMAKWILPRLKATRAYFIEHGGMPCGMWDDEEDFFVTQEEREEKGRKEWVEIITKIIMAFEIIVNDCDMDERYSIDVNEDVKEIYEEGMILFKEYYRNLWT